MTPACARARAARLAHLALLRVAARFDARTPARVTKKMARAARRYFASGKKLPRQRPPTHIEERYREQLLKVLAMLRAAMRPLLDELPDLLDEAVPIAQVGARADAGEGKRARDLMGVARKRLREGLSDRQVESLAKDFASRTLAHSKQQLARQYAAGLGIEPFVRERQLVPVIEAFVDSNVGLIRDLTDKVAHEIEQATLRAIQDGTRHETLAVEIDKRFQLGEDRAALIARDQIGKAYGQANAAQQRAIGVGKFIWRTVKDERVRDEHEVLEGLTFSYDDPPDEGLPGEPINCRCYPEPYLDDFFDDL